MTQQSLSALAAENAPSPDAIVESFESIQSWKTVLTSPDILNETQLIVGRRCQDSSNTTYRLYPRPEDENHSGCIGHLVDEKQYDADAKKTTHTILFRPTAPSEQSDDERHISSLNVAVQQRSDRMDRLDRDLPTIRTTLTDSDWTTDGRTDTRYPEWISANAQLLDAHKELPDSIALPQEIVGAAETMHSVARYKLNASEILDQVSIAISRHDEIDHTEANPDGFRYLLETAGFRTDSQ